MTTATLNPSVETLKARFGSDVRRASTSCGDTIMHVARGKAHEILAWLKHDPVEAYA